MALKLIIFIALLAIGASMAAPQGEFTNFRSGFYPFFRFGSPSSSPLNYQIYRSSTLFRNNAGFYQLSENPTFGFGGGSSGNGPELTAVASIATSPLGDSRGTSIVRQSPAVVY